MQIFTAAPHHDVLLLVTQVALLLLSARLLGEVAQRLGQPAVVGEILAGIVLGPSLLSSVIPGLGQVIVPQTPVQGYLLEVVSLIGAMFLLLITGLETDLALIRRHARTAVGVSFGGIIVTFSTGFVLGQLLPDFLLAEGGSRLVFSLFVATAMSISAIPVIAKVLMDLNLMRRDIGQTIIAAGMSDDTIGWMLLSVVAGLASGEAVSAGSVLRIVLSVLAFMVVSFTLGRWLVRQLLAYVQDRMISRDRLLTLVVVLTFGWGAITQALNLEAVLGAFVMGILFGQMRRLPSEVHGKLESISLGIFSPIFFAVAGLKVNLQALLDLRLFLIALAVIAVASIGKIVGTYAGARLIGGQGHWTALSYGAGLNARGAMEIIIATIGLQLGILSQDMFSIIVLMAMATSLMAPAALRWVLKRVTPDEEEAKRLEQEELAAESFFGNLHRVLLPVRMRPAGHTNLQSLEARLLESLASDLSVTLLTVVSANGKALATEQLGKLQQVFHQAEVNRRVVESNDPAEVILNELSKDYDLLVLGASERNSDKVVFNPIVDYLVRVAPCPTLVVKGNVNGAVWPPRTILVPTTGGREGRYAAETAFALAQGEGARVVLLNVLTQRPAPYRYGTDDHDRQVGAAYDMLQEFRKLGEANEVLVDTEVRFGPDPESMILTFAKQQSADLIVLGTDVRAGSNRLYLGPRVERLLEGADCPVVVVNGG